MGAHWAREETLREMEPVIEKIGMGLFHHSTCPWNMSKECYCAAGPAREALALYAKLASDVHPQFTNSQSDEPTVVMKDKIYEIPDDCF